jgi:hypothetical protein
MPWHRALNLLLEGDVKLLRLVKPLVGLRVWRVRDVLEAAGGGRHVVGHAGEAQHAGSPCAIVVGDGLCCLLSCKLLPLPLELSLDGL